MRRAALCALLGALSALAADVERYSVDWDDVPLLDEAATTLDKLPRGCSCDETGVTDADCTVFDCSCTCDLTAGQCDANCCCDSECTADELELFEAADACLPEGPEESSVRTCTDVESVVTVNTKYGMTVEEVTDSALETLLCVEVQNTEVIGDYYSYPGEQTDSVFAKSSVIEEFTFQSEAAAGEAAASVYTAGVAMVSAHSAASGDYASYLRVPRAGLDGTCDDNNYARFMEPVEADGDGQGCVRRVASSLAAECATLFDATPFLGNVTVGKTPAAAVADPTQYLSVEVTRVWVVDEATGEATASATAAVPAAAYSGGVCAGALLGVAYSVAHDGAGALVNVTAEVTVGDVSTQAAYQAFSIDFEGLSAVTRSLALGNLADFPRSGNPGYVTGLPLRAGRLEVQGSGLTEQQAIAERVDGLHLMGADAAGACSAAEASAQPVLFEQDQRTACTLALTRAELDAWCAANTGVPDFFNITEQYLAIYGNSDPLSPVEWLELSVPDTTGSGSTTCADKVTGMHYEVLSANIGNVLNPQRKVLAARVTYSTETLEFELDDDAEAQVFEFTNSVTFLYLSEDEIDAYSPPLPPSAITVPYDAYYPFMLGPAAGRAGGAAAWWLVGVWGVVGLYLAR